MNKQEVTSLLWDAFLLGWGYGQGKMEEDMDNNFFDAFLQGLSSNGVGGGSAPCHTVAIPNTIQIIEENGKLEAVAVPDYEGKYIRYKLHSDKWRNAMLAKKEEFLQLIEEINTKKSTKTPNK